MARKRTVAFNEVCEGDRRSIQFPSHGLRNTRDLHTLLLEAAYALQANPEVEGADIAMWDCALSKSAVQREVEQFRSICRPPISRRLRVLDSRASLPEQSQSPAMGVQLKTGSSSTPTQASQEAVMATLLQRYVRGLTGLTMVALLDETGASVPTVYQALRRYANCLAPRNRDDKLIRIQAFSRTNWWEWMERNNRLSSVSFVDRSGSPRSATRLAKGLARLQRDDLAIGGLMGTMRHLPALDATAAPFLDILVHGTARSDLSFIEQVDPGLQRSRDPNEPAHVVVHFVDRPQSLFMREDGQNWGALPDCIANMQRARLAHQIEDAVKRITSSCSNPTNGHRCLLSHKR